MKKLMLGNEAVARGAYEAGVRVVSSYPGTPSTEITEFCAAYPEIDCEWAPNEKVAVETAFGAAMLAGLGAGIYENTAQIREMRRIERTFEPKMSKEERDARLKAWRRAVERSLAWKEE